MPGGPGNKFWPTLHPKLVTEHRDGSAPRRDTDSSCYPLVIGPQTDVVKGPSWWKRQRCIDIYAGAKVRGTAYGGQKILEISDQQYGVQ